MILRESNRTLYYCARYALCGLETRELVDCGCGWDGCYAAGERFQGVKV